MKIILINKACRLLSTELIFWNKANLKKNILTFCQGNRSDENLKKYIISGALLHFSWFPQGGISQSPQTHLDQPDGKCPESSGQNLWSGFKCETIWELHGKNEFLPQYFCLILPVQISKYSYFYTLIYLSSETFDTMKILLALWQIASVSLF